MNHPAILTENLRPTPAWLIAAMSAVIAWGVSTIITPGDWYASLHKPSWHLSAQEFSDGFAAVYLTMAVALLLLLRAEPSATRTQSLLVFSLQLVLSALWGPLFFGLQMQVVAFAAVLMVWATALASSLSAADVRASAAWFQVPHLLWVSFLLVLNGVIVALNF